MTWSTTGALAAVVGAAFLIGWWLGRQNPATTAGAPTAAPSETVPNVQLKLDTSDLTLIPDAGLRLKPMPKLDADELWTSPSMSATNTPPQQGL